MSRLPSGYIWHNGQVVKSYTAMPRGYQKQAWSKPWKNGKSAANKNYRAQMARNYRAAASVGPSARGNYRTGGYMGMEKKFADFRVDDDAFTQVWAGGEMDPNGTADSVSVVAQGDGESNRDGRVYYIHEIYIHGTVQVQAVESQTAPQPDNIARVALVWDKQTNGAQMNAEDCFLTIGASDDIDSFRNLQFVQRFTVLANKKINIKQSTAVVNEGAANLFAAGTTTVPFSMSYKFRTPLKVSCSGTTAAIASIADNSLHVIGCSQSACTLSYASRLRFTG